MKTILLQTKTNFDMSCFMKEKNCISKSDSCFIAKQGKIVIVKALLNWDADISVWIATGLNITKWSTTDSMEYRKQDIATIDGWLCRLKKKKKKKLANHWT